MLVFAYALYVPAGIALTSAYASQLLADTLRVTIGGWALFMVILAAAVLVAYLGIRTSSWVDLVLAGGEVAVIAALAITVLVKIGPAYYSAAVLSPVSSPTGQLTDVTNAMIYGVTAFAGFEAAAALGEEARHARRSVPASMIGIVIVTGLFYLLVVCAEAFGLGRHNISSLARQPNPLGYLTSRYWSPSALWAIDLVVVLTGLGFVIAAVNALIRILFAMGRERVLPPSLARLSSRRTPVVAIGWVAVLTLILGLPLTYAYGGARTFGYLAGAAGLSVVLIYLAVNVSSVRAFRDEFRLWRHLLVPATATVFFLFPLWGILHPHGWTLMAMCIPQPDAGGITLTWVTISQDGPTGWSRGSDHSVPGGGCPAKQVPSFGIIASTVLASAAVLPGRRRTAARHPRLHSTAPPPDAAGARVCLPVTSARQPMPRMPGARWPGRGMRGPDDY